jgi:hypothetical protein
MSFTHWTVACTDIPKNKTPSAREPRTERDAQGNPRTTAALGLHSCRALSSGLRRAVEQPEQRLSPRSLKPETQML